MKVVKLCMATKYVAYTCTSFMVQLLCNSLAHKLVGGATMPTNGCKCESMDGQAGSRRY